MLQKRSKNSLNCFRGQILSETKYTGNQYTGNTSAYDLSIGKGNICSVKTKNPPQHVLYPLFESASFK